MLTKQPPSKKQQAISGVSPEFESVVEEMYPSIAATGIGACLNNLYECINLRIWGVKVSHVFALLTAPLGAFIYLLMKVSGSRYVVTNRSVKRVASLGCRLYESIPLSQIVGVTIDRDSRQTLLLMRGIPYAERFQQVIVEMRDARSQVAASLLQIQSRK